MENLKEEVVKTIRGVLVSTKGSLDLHRLQKDFRMIVGDDIPYRRLGYRSLEEFLSNVPTLKVTKLPNGEILIDAVATSQSKHISQLVAKQKTTSKKGGRGFGRNKYKTSPSRFGGFGVPRIRRSMGKPFSAPTPSYRRHSDFNPTYKPIPEKRRSVFERLGPKFVSESPVSPLSPLSPLSPVRRPYRSPTAKSPIKEKRRTAHFSVAHSSVADRLKKYRNVVQVHSEDEEEEVEEVEDIEDESPSRPYRNPYPPEEKKEEIPIASTSTPKPDSPNRLKDILNKISDFKLNPPVENKTPPPSLEKENQISGPTNRMNDILNKISELKTKDLNNKIEEKNFPIPTNEDINLRTYSMPAAYGMPAPVFSAPDIDRPRMRIQPNLPNIPNMPPPASPSNFQFLAPFPSNSLRSSVQSRLLQIRHNVPSMPLPPNPEQIVEEPKQRPNYFRNDIPRFQKKSPELSPTNPSPIQVEQKGNQIPVISGNRPPKEEYCDKIQLTTPEDAWELVTKGTIVKVTCAVSPVKIWCRFLNSSSAEIFDQLMYLLGREYATGDHFTSQFFVGGYFIAHYNGCWYRVLVQEVLENECQCSLIDHGEEVVIPQNDLRRLLKKFAQIPAQAVLCKLAGLKELETYPNSFTKLQQLVDNHYFAVKNESCKDYTIELYESGKQDISMNHTLLKQIISGSVVTTLKENGTYKGYITHVEQNGLIYIRVEADGLKNFFHLLAAVSENENKLRSVPQPVEKEVYLQKNQQSQLFERCMIIDQDPKKVYAQFLFIDSGRVAISCQKEVTLYFIDSLIIYSYPPLAIKLLLDLDEVPENFPDKIQQLTEQYAQKSLMAIRILRFGQMEDNIVPVCDIFMQPEFQKKLISLKASLKKNVDPHLKEEIVELPAHTRPEVDSYLDAKVVFAINPSHFYVHLYEYAQRFKELMKQLQDRYNDLMKMETPAQNLRIGQICAFKYTDNIWYRVQVIKIDSNQVHIFFSDFGYDMDVPIDCLYHLEAPYYVLPHQAVKMKIFGIKPKFGVEWSEEDCEYFDSLVNNKAFVCQVKEVGNSVYLEISAEIIDTTQAKDVNIGEFLVDVNFALSA